MKTIGYLIGLVVLAASICSGVSQTDKAPTGYFKISIWDQLPSKNKNFEPTNRNDPNAVWGKLTKGLVKDTLSSVPTLNDKSDSDSENVRGMIKDPDMFKYFFANDKSNKVVPFDMQFNVTKITETDKDGYYFSEYTNDAFFPIDNLGFDTNPSNLIDLGGVHEAASASINLDTLGLTPGKNYPFDFFYCERQTTESHIKITTTIQGECLTKDFCGVCMGKGDCCKASECAPHPSGSACWVPKCPDWDDKSVTADNWSNKCTYTPVVCDNSNLCQDNTCNVVTGQCQATNKSLNGTECKYALTCDPAKGPSFDLNSCDDTSNKCKIPVCNSDNSCTYKDRVCQTDDKCKVPSCDPKSGCVFTSVPTPPADNENCIYADTCNPATGIWSNKTIVGCSLCKDATWNKCDKRVDCNNVTKQWIVVEAKEYDDGNACTIDSCNRDTQLIENVMINCQGCTYCDSKGKYECIPKPGVNNSYCDDGNKCTNNVCDIASGNCTKTDVVCEKRNLCEIPTCDPIIGCVYTPVVCEEVDKCSISTCNIATGQCEAAPRVCQTDAFCIDSRCDKNLGCLYYDKLCVPEDSRCQVGICNNETKSCEDRDRDPKPFVCKTAAVVSTAVIAGVVVAGAVALGLAIFGGKKGYDYWKNTQDQKINGSTTNPLYEANPSGGENPMFDSTT
eukprot:gene8043-9450_t